MRDRHKILLKKIFFIKLNPIEELQYLFMKKIKISNEIAFSHNVLFIHKLLRLINDFNNGEINKENYISLLKDLFGFIDLNSDKTEWFLYQQESVIELILQLLKNNKLVNDNSVLDVKLTNYGRKILSILNEIKNYNELIKIILRY